MAKRETFVKESKKCVCKLTLNRLGFSNKNYTFLNDEKAIPYDVYTNIVLFSPSSQSNLGTKLSARICKHIDELVIEIKKNLDIKNTYFFSSYESKDKTKEDLSVKIKKDNKTYLCLYCPGNFTESLYASIRNALAHGNIIKKGNYFYLYSVSSKERGEKDDFDKNLTFLLRLCKLNKMDAYITAFNKYN